MTSAVVAIDVQNGIFARAETLVHDAEGVLERLAALVRAARNVFLVQDDAGPGIWRPDTWEWQLHEHLPRRADAIGIRKTFGDAFRATELDARLRALDVRHVVIGGAMTDFSVRATLQRALLLGYEVTLAADAHSTLDAPDGSAAELIALLNREVRAAERRGLPVHGVDASRIWA